MEILVRAQRDFTHIKYGMKHHSEKKSTQHNLLRHNILFTIRARTSGLAILCIFLLIMSRHVQEEDHDPRVSRPRPRDKFCLR